MNVDISFPKPQQRIEMKRARGATEANTLRTGRLTDYKSRYEDSEITARGHSEWRHVALPTN